MVLGFLNLLRNTNSYALSEAGSGVNWADLMAAQDAFGADFYDRSIILHPKHRPYYRSGRPIIKIGPKGALGSHEIRPIHSAPSLGQSIVVRGVRSSGETVAIVLLYARLTYPKKENQLMPSSPIVTVLGATRE